jgi:hypothetical protein
MRLRLQQKLSIYIGLSIFSISIAASLFFYFRYSGEIQSHINNRLRFGAESVARGIDFSRKDELFKQMLKTQSISSIVMITFHQ